MNHLLRLIQSARESTTGGEILSSSEMLSELLALHEEMIAQLRLEQLGALGSAEFLTSMIDEHRRTAATLRAELDRRQLPEPSSGMIVITGEASSTAAKLSITSFAEQLPGPNSVANQMTVKR